MPPQDISMLKLLVQSLLSLSTPHFAVMLLRRSLVQLSIILSSLNMCVFSIGVLDMKADEQHCSFRCEAKKLAITLQLSSRGEETRNHAASLFACEAESPCNCDETSNLATIVVSICSTPRACHHKRTAHGMISALTSASCIRTAWARWAAGKQGNGP